MSHPGTYKIRKKPKVAYNNQTNPISTANDTFCHRYVNDTCITIQKTLLPSINISTAA